ncbi:hypothetical protein CPC08DRAFT_703208 [Agrocybe pediades]|nr:hypothetical protein CPC08DRAFT_703208 [Agrocybe pediades]
MPQGADSQHTEAHTQQQRNAPSESVSELEPDLFGPMPATNYDSFVNEILARNSKRTKSPTIDQQVLRNCIDLASSFLVTDTSTDPKRGVTTWFHGLDHLVNLVVLLHKNGELELETVSCASRACSECWTAAGNWRGLDECRIRLRDIGGKLKRILDPNEKTYKGDRVYAP